MKHHPRFTIAAILIFAGALSACEKDGSHGHSHDDGAAAPAAPAAVAAPAPAEGEGATNEASARSDEMRVNLAPNQGTEVKLVMNKGQKVDYSWQSEGGPVNHDTHGEPPGGGKAHRYGKAVQVPSDSGSLVAVFDGEHGWFWRNRNDRAVTITLKVSGQYQAIQQK
ncbi:hypothetical protein [Massilia sp. X63]|uniref:hypothetical protein n=1 Tax=Massilia sp. X63 TaxID=3237285 RepID=UPI0034DD3327